MDSQAGMVKKFRANFDFFEEIWLFIQIFLLATVLPFLLKFQSLPGVMKMLAFLQKYFYYKKYGAKERLTIFNLMRDFFVVLRAT